MMDIIIRVTLAAVLVLGTGLGGFVFLLWLWSLPWHPEDEVAE